MPINRFKRKTATANKYNNKKVFIDGIKFDSKKEGERYKVLKQYEQNKTISGLNLQVKYELIPSIKESHIEQLKTKQKTVYKTVQLAINYVCDFSYIKDNETVLEDVKASPKMLDKVYLIKEKLMRWKYGLVIRRIYKADEPI